MASREVREIEGGIGPEFSIQTLSNGVLRITFATEDIMAGFYCNAVAARIFGEALVEAGVHAAEVEAELVREFTGPSPATAEA